MLMLFVLTDIFAGFLHVGYGLAYYVQTEVDPMVLKFNYAMLRMYVTQ